jgi:hypothetical protein
MSNIVTLSSLKVGLSANSPRSFRKPRFAGITKPSSDRRFGGIVSEEREQWLKYLNSDDQTLALKAFLAWNDRAYGKPSQAVEVTSRDEGINKVIVNI